MVDYVRVRKDRYLQLLWSELNSAFDQGQTADGEWWTGGMADAEWLARVIGANEVGKNRISDVRRRMGHYVDKAMLAASPMNPNPET